MQQRARCFCIRMSSVRQRHERQQCPVILLHGVDAVITEPELDLGASIASRAVSISRFSRYNRHLDVQLSPCMVEIDHEHYRLLVGFAAAHVTASLKGADLLTEAGRGRAKRLPLIFLILYRSLPCEVELGYQPCRRCGERFSISGAWATSTSTTTTTSAMQDMFMNTQQEG